MGAREGEALDGVGKWRIGRWRREERGNDSDERMRFISTVRFFFLLWGVRFSFSFYSLLCFFFFWLCICVVGRYVSFYLIFIILLFISLFVLFPVFFCGFCSELNSSMRLDHVFCLSDLSLSVLALRSRRPFHFAKRRRSLFSFGIFQLEILCYYIILTYNPHTYA